MPPEAGQGAPGAAAGQGSPGAGAAGAGAGAGNNGAGQGTPPPAGAGAPYGAAGQGTPPPTDWYAGFQNEELKGFAKNKGWKDSSEAVESYRHLEKSVGVPPERLIKLPEKADDPSWQEINYKLGVPKDSKEYQFDVPKEFGDEKFAGMAKDWFHKAGVPRTKAEAVVKNWNEYVAQKAGEQQAAHDVAVNQQKESLTKEWGAAHDQNLKMALSAARAFWPAPGTKEGFDTKIVNALQSSLGLDGTMKFLHSLQTKIGEDSFVTGHQNNNSFGGLMTPDQAKAQIALRKKDVDFTSRLMKKDTAAIAEWDKLNKMAAGVQV